MLDSLSCDLLQLAIMLVGFQPFEMSLLGLGVFPALPELPSE